MERFLRVGYHAEGVLTFDLDADIIELEPLQLWSPVLMDGATTLKQEKRIHLDVRTTAEVADTGLIEKAINIPLQSLLPRTDEVPEGKIYINCRSAARARFAASMLVGVGKTDIVIVDDVFPKLKEQGFIISKV